MYDAEFFKRRIARYHDKEVHVAKALHSIWTPDSVYDAGCAIGSYLSEFQRRGATVAGCEKYAEVARPFMPENVRNEIVAHDLTEGLIPNNRYDLVMCIEVAEHVEPEGSQRLVDNLVRLAWRHGRGRILFTAAPRGQRGTGHINCRSMLEWMGMFSIAGALYSSDDTMQALKALDRIGDPLDLMANLSVFRWAQMP